MSLSCVNGCVKSWRHAVNDLCSSFVFVFSLCIMSCHYVFFALQFMGKADFPSISENLSFFQVTLV